MLSKAKIKFVKSLQLKKYRKQEQLFVVQGAKSVRELLDSDYEITMIIATADFLNTHTPRPGIEVHEAVSTELEMIGEFQSNEAAVAVARMIPNTSLMLDEGEFGLILDDIRDPGNLGTIIRTADWYGINKIIASEETADMYNGKVIAATMGSFTRVRVFYTTLESFLPKQDKRIFGAYMEGNSAHEINFGDSGFILLGNEARGISAGLDAYVTDRITIPRYGHAESLNAAIATAVLCDNLRRRRI